MIPKVLHYCWFGGNPLNNVAKKCIESWRKKCPDYTIVEWNESNFDIHSNVFVEEAYQQKKWAFVSDYVRLYVLYHFGGIYLDADVEILKNLDDVMFDAQVVTGYQEDITIPAAIMSAEAGNNWIKALLDYYTDRHFILPDGRLDMQTNSEIITILSAKQFGFHIGDIFIDRGAVLLKPSVYFAPYKKTVFRSADTSIEDRYKIDPEKTYAIHHAVGSWTPKTKKDKFVARLYGVMRIILTEPLYRKIKGRIMKRKMGV